jgi:hypothetical protein
MNAQISLYDALLSVNIPGDKARAVVAAVEREMTSLLATKSDLEHFRLLSKQELTAAHDSLKQEMHGLHGSLKQEMHSLHDSLRQEMHALHGSLKQEMHALHGSLKLDIRHQSALITIWLGSAMIVGMTLLFAALKLTSSSG